MHTPPRHVALIMDGNGRWAEQRGCERAVGHAAGEEAVVASVRAAVDNGVSWLTLFAFSTENWRRPQPEVDFLMRLNQQVIRNNIRAWHAMDVRMRFLGVADARIPKRVHEDIAFVEDLTRGNTTLTLTVALDHGGQGDLARAARSIVAHGVPADQITEDTLAGHMQFPDLPDVDLLVRTSAEHRLSNFLLWQAAYAELVFLDVLWPDFRAEHFRQVLDLYHRRRFGEVSPPAARAAAVSASA